MLHVPRHGFSMSQPHSSLKNIADIIQSLTVQLYANPKFHAARVSYCIFNKSTHALGSLDPPSSSSSTFFSLLAAVDHLWGNLKQTQFYVFFYFLWVYKIAFGLESQFAQQKGVFSSAAG